MIRVLRSLAAGLMLSSLSAQATDILISDQQVTELGILLGTPQAGDRKSDVAATARVVVPPAGQFAVSSVEPGVVLRLHAAVGDRVEQGQLLAEIRSPGFITVQREYLQARSEAVLQAAQLQRDQQLFDEGIIARRRLQETEMQANTAQARQAELRQLLELSGMSAAQLQQLAEQRRLQDVLAIHAPLSGSVVELMTMSGERLEAMSPIYRIADLSRLWLEIQVAGELAHRVQPGMSVLVEGRSLAGNSEEIRATVLSVGQSRDEHSQTVSVRAEVIEPDGRLQPGQFVSVRLLEVAEGQDEDASRYWTLPLAAVVHDGEQQLVFLRTADGFQRLAVELLSSEAGTAHIAANLDDSSRVAIAGVVALKALLAESGEDNP
jgi:cobalt-zinc-cadmium efflux system membrane fusion protein